MSKKKLSSSKPIITSRGVRNSDQDAQDSKRRKLRNNKATPGSNLVAEAEKKYCILVDSLPLYTDISTGTSPIPNLAKEWIESFQEDQVEAVYQLLGLISKVSGCPVVVSKDSILDEVRIAKVIGELEDNMKEGENPEYPFASKSKEGKKIKKRILSFFQQIVKHGLHEVFSEPTLLELVSGWLIAMSNSPYRPFRLVATSLSLNFMTYLCEGCQELESEKDISVQQTKADGKGRGKGKGKVAFKNNDAAKLKEAMENLKLLEKFLEKFFKGVFEHRYRDVDSNIRSECIRELKNWILKYPNHFLNDNYLRYLGWQLSDKIAGVRTEALLSITEISEKESFITNLNPFINSFKTRILEIALKEVDITAKCYAIHLSLIIYRRGSLTDEEREDLIQLLFNREDKVRKAIAPFIKHLINEDYLQKRCESILGVQTDSASDSDISKISVKCLIEVFMLRGDLDSDTIVTQDDQTSSLFEVTDRFSIVARDASKRNEDFVALAVRALWNGLDYLRDWKNLLELATKEASARSKKKQVVLEDGEEKLLLEIIEACFKILSEEDVSQTSEAKTSKKAEEPSQFTLLRHHMAQELRTVSGLLNRFSSSEDLVIPTLKVIQVSFDGELFMELNKLKGFETLLKQVQKIFMNYSRSNILFHAAQTLKTLGTFSSAPPHEFITSMESLVDDLQTAVLDSSADQEDKLSSLQKFRALLTISSWGQSNVFSTSSQLALALWKNIDEGIQLLEEQDVMISLSSYDILYRAFLWNCQSLARNEASDAEESPEHITRLIELRDKLLRVGSDILETNSDGYEEVLFDAHRFVFVIINDLCWLSRQFPALESAPLIPSINSIEKCSTKFVLNSLYKWEKAITSQPPSFSEEGITQELKNNKILNDVVARHCFAQIVTTMLRSTLLGIFSPRASIEVIFRYGNLDPVMDEAVKLLFTQSLKNRLKAAKDTSSVQAVTHLFEESLIEAFKRSINQAPLASFDGVLSLAKLIAIVSRSVGTNFARISKVISQIHQTFIRTAARDAKQSDLGNPDTSPIRAFRVITLLVKGIIAPIHARELVKQAKEALKDLSPNEGSNEWTHYFNYLKTLNEASALNDILNTTLVLPAQQEQEPLMGEE